MADGDEEMRVVLLEHRHAVEGYLRISVSDANVEISGRWPFDLDTNDFIHVYATVGSEEFERCVHSLVERGKGTASGIHGGCVALQSRDDGAISIDIEDEAKHAPTRLELRIPTSTSALQARLQEIRNSAAGL